jgi:hypothetical protein
MQKMALSLRLFTFCFAVSLIAACSSTPSESPVQGSNAGAPAGFMSSGPNLSLDSTIGPALVAVNSQSGALESWPIRPGGGSHPQTLSNPLGLRSSGGMAGNGHVVAVASNYPTEVVIYNADNKRKHTLPDPFGYAVDVAIDKSDNLYVLNFVSPASNVAMYPAGSSNPVKLDCRHLGNAQAIAVDNEGDIFVNGYVRSGFGGVVEIPNGPHGPQPQNCSILNLKGETGYVAGIAVDPKTDDLIVLDDPSLCAGGSEGRMTIYPKPYSKTNSVSRVIGQNCSGFIRLNADSTIIFVADQDVSGSFSFILQRSYPDGRAMGTYYGNSPGGFITIPNSRPN